MKKFLLIMASVLATTAFVACSDENTGWGSDKKPVIEDMGYLNIADGGLSVIFEQELGSADIDPEKNSGTRTDATNGETGGETVEDTENNENTGTTTQPESVDCEDFWIEVLTEDGEPVTVDGTETGTPIKFQYKDWLAEDKSGVPGYVAEPTDKTAANYNEYVAGMKGIKLPAGTYVIRARSTEGELAPLSYKAEYEGYSNPFTVKRGAEISGENAVTVECTLAYVKVSVQFDEILASLIDPAETEVKVALGADDEAISHTFVAPTRDGERYTYNESDKDDNDLTKTSYFIYMLPQQGVANPLNLYLTTIYSGSEINDQLLPVVDNVKAGEYRKITIKLEHGDEGQVYFVVEVKKLVYNQPVTVAVNNYLIKDSEGNGGILTEGSIPDIMFQSKYKIGSMLSIEDDMFDTNKKFKGPLMTLQTQEPIEALYVTATATNGTIKNRFKALGLIVEDTATAAEGATPAKPAIAGVNIMLDVATAEGSAGLSQSVKEGLDALGMPNGKEAFKNLATKGVSFSMAGLMELIHHGNSGEPYNGTYTFTFTPVVNGKTVTPISVTVFLDAITIDWPGRDMEKEHKVTAGMQVKVNIFAKYSIKQLNVTIKGALGADQLNEVGLSDKFDLAALDSSSTMGAALKNLGFPVGSEVKGKTELVFDITEFMPMLAVFPGHTQFGIEVVDTENNKLYREIKLILE